MKLNIEISGKRYFLVEYCDMCPFSEAEEYEGITEGYWCKKVNPSKEILQYEEGIIPDWCPLPKEDSNQESTSLRSEK